MYASESKFWNIIKQRKLHSSEKLHIKCSRVRLHRRYSMLSTLRGGNLTSCWLKFSRAHPFPALLECYVAAPECITLFICSQKWCSNCISLYFHFSSPPQLPPAPPQMERAQTNGRKDDDDDGFCVVQQCTAVCSAASSFTTAL